MDTVTTSLKFRALLGRRVLDNAINMSAQGAVIIDEHVIIISMNKVFSFKERALSAAI
jgi:hypothetical protein